MKSKGKAAELLGHKVCWVTQQTRCIVNSIVFGCIKEVKGSKNLETLGIEFHPTALNTPQGNEKSKRMTGTVKNGIRTLPDQARAQTRFRSEYFYIVCHMQNRMARPGGKKTTEKRLTDVKPNVRRLQILGSSVWTRDPDKTCKALDKKAMSHVLLQCIAYKTFCFILQDDRVAAASRQGFVKGGFISLKKWKIFVRVSSTQLENSFSNDYDEAAVTYMADWYKTPTLGWTARIVECRKDAGRSELCHAASEHLKCDVNKVDSEEGTKESQTPSRLSRIFRKTPVRLFHTVMMASEERVMY